MERMEPEQALCAGFGNAGTGYSDQHGVEFISRYRGWKIVRAADCDGDCAGGRDSGSRNDSYAGPAGG